MRDDEPSTSSRIVWSVALVAGLLLLVWGTGWLPVDFGGGETGELAPDLNDVQLGDATFDAPMPFDPSQIPPQSEPEIVDVPMASDAAPQYGEVPGDLVAGHEVGEPPPSAFDVPSFDVPTLRESPVQEPVDRHVAAKPIVKRPVWRTAENGPESGELSPFELVRAERVAPPEQAAGPQLDLGAIDTMVRKGRVAEAHSQLSRIWWEHPGARPSIQSRIERTASVVFFEPDVHFVEPYVLQSGDRLSSIGERYDVPWQYLVRMNRKDPRSLRPGDELKVVPGPFHATIDLSDFTLVVHNNGLFVRRYTIGVGLYDQTPPGRFSVMEKRTNPEFPTPDGRTIPGGDPRNPLGGRWIGLGSGYALHGTNDATRIGRAAKFGCLFLKNDDLAELYDLLGVGSEVTVVE